MYEEKTTLVEERFAKGGKAEGNVYVSEREGMVDVRNGTIMCRLSWPWAVQSV